MSHNFTKPQSIHPAERRQEKQIAFMTDSIKTQEALNSLLEGAEPAMRAALIERIAAFLCFVPDEPVRADCPACGRRWGAVYAHACTAASNT